MYFDNCFVKTRKFQWCKKLETKNVPDFSISSSIAHLGSLKNLIASDSSRLQEHYCGNSFQDRYLMFRESKMGCNLFHCEINHTLLIIMILIYMFVSRLITGDNCFFDIVITKNETQSGQFGDKLENVTSPCIIRFVF